MISKWIKFWRSHEGTWLGDHNYFINYTKKNENIHLNSTLFMDRANEGFLTNRVVSKKQVAGHPVTTLQGVKTRHFPEDKPRYVKTFDRYLVAVGVFTADLTRPEQEAGAYYAKELAWGRDRGFWQFYKTAKSLITRPPLYWPSNKTIKISLLLAVMPLTWAMLLFELFI